MAPCGLAHGCIRSCFLCFWIFTRPACWQVQRPSESLLVTPAQAVPKLRVSAVLQYFLEWASSQSQRQLCIGRDWPFDPGWQALDILLLSLSNPLCLLGRPRSPWWEAQLWGSDVLLIYSEMICSLDGVRWSKVQKSNYKLPFVKEGYFPKERKVKFVFASDFRKNLTPHIFNIS